MTGLPHHRYHSQDFVEPHRVRGMVTVLAIILLALVFDYVCLVIGISIGREQERVDQARRKAASITDSVKPAYGLRAYSCSAAERREYLEACRQRLRSNITGGF